MFKRMLAIAWKNTRLRFAAPTEFLFFLILPIIFSFLLGGGLGAPQSDEPLPLLVVDLDGGELAQDLVVALEDTGLVAPDRAAGSSPGAVVPDDVAARLIIPAGFGDALRAGTTVTLQLDPGSDEEAADVAERAVALAASNMSRALAAATGSVTAIDARRSFQDGAARDAAFAQSLEMARTLLADRPDRIEVTLPEAAEVEAFDAAAHGTGGQMITWVFIPLLGISGVFAYERTQGTLRRLLVTPTRKAVFLLGTIGGEVAVSLFQMVLLLTFGALAMGVNWGRSYAGLALLLVAFSLAAVAIGTFYAAFVKTEGQATSLSIASGMAMALLGGCWYPSELFPQAVRTATKILPTAWVMQGLSDLTTRGLGLVDILPETGVLVAFALVFFLLGLWRFRYE